MSEALIRMFKVHTKHHCTVWVYIVSGATVLVSSVEFYCTSLRCEIGSDRK